MTTSIPRHTPNPRLNSLREALHNHTRAAYRDAILTAAETVILRDGYKPAKMNEIAELAGLSVGTLYNCFASKATLFDALVEHHQTRFLADVERPCNSDDPIVQLRTRVIRGCEFVESNGALIKLYIRTKVAEPDLADGTRCVGTTHCQRRLESLVEALIKQGIENGQVRSDVPLCDLVWTLKVLLRRLFLDWAQQPDQVSLRLRGDEVMTLFIEGARTRVVLPILVEPVTR